MSDGGPTGGGDPPAPVPPAPAPPSPAGSAAGPVPDRSFVLRDVPTLSRSGPDRAAHRRDDPDWLAAAWERAQVLVVTPESTVPVRETEAGPRLRLRSPAEIGPAGASGTAGGAGPTGPADRYFLGEHAGVPYFAVPAERDPREDAWAGLREIGADLDDLGAGLVATAVALAGWHRRHPRCPLCGEPTDVVRGGWTRHCPVDGSEHWPRVDPAVIMLVHDGADRCVLGRQPSWAPGRYSILAGFVEPGESAEAAVVREVAEEVGLSVRDVQYVASQPWPFPSSLMLGFLARADGAAPLRVDSGELDDARWFSREQIRHRDGLRGLPPPVSIAHRIISDWLGDPSRVSG